MIQEIAAERLLAKIERLHCPYTDELQGKQWCWMCVNWRQPGVVSYRYPCPTLKAARLTLR